MRQPFLLLVFIFANIVLVACTKESEVHQTEYKEYTFEEIPSDVKLPSKVWDQLEFKKPMAEHSKSGSHGKASEEKKSEEKKSEGSSLTSSEMDIVFSEVKVFLVQKNFGVVKDSAVKINLAKGGGEIDLAQYLTDQQGSFYVNFEFPAFEDATEQKVIFQSKAKKRKLDDKVWGAGCNQAFDITKAIQSSLHGDGLKLNTSRERHTTVLGGTFFFSAKHEKEIMVAQVTFKDSLHPYLFCEGL